jgi:filamentous hemagglutinin
VQNACPPRIINKKYAGETYYPSNSLLRSKYPNGVQFDSNGFPDFSPYSTTDVKIKITGEYADDFEAANRAAGHGGKKPPTGYTWHHHQDMTTMQLVPADLHNAVRYTGGMALLKQLLGLP